MKSLFNLGVSLSTECNLWKYIEFCDLFEVKWLASIIYYSSHWQRGATHWCRPSDDLWYLLSLCSKIGKEDNRSGLYFSLIGICYNSIFLKWRHRKGRELYIYIREGLSQKKALSFFLGAQGLPFDKSTDEQLKP